MVKAAAAGRGWQVMGLPLNWVNIHNVDFLSKIDKKNVHGEYTYLH
jgi:hypothetical protein